MKPLAAILFLLLTSACANIQQSSILVGVGGAYIPTVPGDQMTGHNQFHLSLEYVVPVNDIIDIRTSYNHYSNGAQLGIGRYPNQGFDSIGTQFVLRIK